MGSVSLRAHAERRTRRHTQFLNAGKVIFGDHGFQAAKVRDICAEAGLTERYYYESFGDLRDLFEAVYFRELDVLRQTLDRALAGAPRKPEAMAHALIEAYFTLLRTDTRLARILIVEIYGAAANIKDLYRRGVKQLPHRASPASSEEMTSRRWAVPQSQHGPRGEAHGHDQPY